MRNALLTVLLACACTTAPITGRRQLNLIGEGTMNQLGLQTFQQALSQARPDQNPQQRDEVARVAERIAAAAEKEFHPGYQWQVAVIDDPKTVNAWCLPGGKIGVYSGILPIAQDDAGLAVVLGHEVAHALAHHGAERLSRMELMQLGEAGLLAAISAKEPGATQLAGAALGIGAQLGIELPFSRSQESEADRIGLVLMAKAGYDPAAALDFWQRMTAQAGSGQPPAFLSDHPSNQQRIADLQRWLPEARQSYVARP